MKKIILALAILLSATLLASQYSPETWFHIIDGNASKEGLAADIEAIAEAGIGGIQLFHGGWGGESWPGVKEPIPCLSEKWADLIKFAETECHKRGLTFKMQNCPGWSMSGGPWITPDKAMRKLVAFEPGKMPKWDKEDDYHEIGSATFPWLPIIEDGGVSAVTFPNPQQINHHWAYEPDADLVVYEDEREVFRRVCPQGAWQDDSGMTFNLPQRIRRIVYGKPTPKIRAEVQSRRYGTRTLDVRWGETRSLDNWEAKAGWALRDFEMSTNTIPICELGAPRTLVFGHVNARRRNSPAPKEGTGWECDKMDPRGFEANWNGYLGKLVKTGVKIDGTLVDSWECGCQTWTWKMEEEFEKRNGYKLRPWLPALFGHVLKSEAATERFLLDWRRTCSRLIEDNYYGTMARLAHENGMSIQFETAFGDVVPGDIMRFWKYADEPMCEFWSPFDNDGGFCYTHNFKPVRPCVSAAHVYGKRRVSAEAFTSMKLSWNENFQELKENANRHFARGVTHLVLHTYTHNPVVGGKPPSTSFGNAIGTPFLRLQPWWKYMPEFTKYLETCCRELERGKPVVDILWYLGDALAHKPNERDDLFGNRYKYDYLNNDALMTRVDVKDGRLVFPDGMSYRVLWIPAGTFLLPETAAKIAELEAKGARVVHGELKPDWPSPLQSIGETGKGIGWYQRREGELVITFLARKNGESAFVYQMPGQPTRVVPTIPNGPSVGEEVFLFWERPYGPWTNGETDGLCRAAFRAKKGGRYVLDLGKVCHWATVKVNGETVARLWSEPYRCDLSKFVVEGTNMLDVYVTAPIHNRLVLDAAKPESERTTWTIAGPKADAPLADAGLYGPVSLKVLQ